MLCHGSNRLPKEKWVRYKSSCFTPSKKFGFKLSYISSSPNFPNLHRWLPIIFVLDSPSLSLSLSLSHIYIYIYIYWMSHSKTILEASVSDKFYKKYTVYSICIKSNATDTNYFTTFLQNIDVANFLLVFI